MYNCTVRLTERLNSSYFFYDLHFISFLYFRYLKRSNMFYINSYGEQKKFSNIFYTFMCIFLIYIY